MSPLHQDSQSHTFSKLYSNLHHWNADYSDVHQLQDNTSVGWWIKTGKDSYLLLQLLPVCVSARVHSSLITKNSGEKSQTKTENYIPVHSLPPAALSLCTYLFVCCLRVFVGDTCVTDKLPVLPFFTLSPHQEDSIFDFPQTSQYAPYCLYKAKHIHGLSNKIHCLLHAFILNNFSNLHHTPFIY